LVRDGWNYPLRMVGGPGKRQNRHLGGELVRDGCNYPLRVGTGAPERRKPGINGGDLVGVR
jgi:hypothetical protein